MNYSYIPKIRPFKIQMNFPPFKTYFLHRSSYSSKAKCVPKIFYFSQEEDPVDTLVMNNEFPQHLRIYMALIKKTICPCLVNKDKQPKNEIPPKVLMKLLEEFNIV